MMKKLMLSVVSLATMLTLTQSVYALGSTDLNGNIESVQPEGAPVEGLGAEFDPSFDNVDPTVMPVIENLNKGAALSDEIKTIDNKTNADLKDLLLLTQIQDLDLVKTTNGNKEDYEIQNGGVFITWTVEGLSTVKDSEVYVLHYGKNGWELLNPTKVEGNKITCYFTDLSPVAVVYKPKAASKPTESKPNTSKPSTGYDDGGPFTTDACGNVFDRWGNEVYHSPVCVNNSVEGNGDYNFVNTSDR